MKKHVMAAFSLVILFFITKLIVGGVRSRPYPSMADTNFIVLGRQYCNSS